MKSLMATLTVAVLVGVQPVSGQIGQEVAPPTGAVTPRPQEPVRTEVRQQVQERTHVVRTGDTLWDLANHYYQNPYTWPTIAQANRTVVEDPHWIYPDEVLVIPGAATMVAEGPPSAPGNIMPVAIPPQPQPQPVGVPPSPTSRTRFFRESQTDGNIFIDEEIRRAGVQPGEHYAAPWVMDPANLPLIGIVVRSVDAPPGDSEQDLYIHPFDDIYVEYRGSTRPAPGERLLVVDVLREFDDGADEFVIRPAGVLTVQSSDGETMTARVTEHWAPFNRGARVLPLDHFSAVMGLAEPITDGPLGYVRGFMIDQPLYATSDHGFLDLNQSQVRIGDVVMIYRVPRSDGTVLPPEPVAFAKIVRVGPDGSTFRVTKVMQRRLEPGLPAQVVSRIP
jgi:hypothetical protein